MKTLSIQQKEGYLLVQLDRGKANALNQLMIDEFRQLIKDATTDSSIGGIVLTGKPHFFSGGVDLLEIYEYSSEATRHFWGSFIQLSAEMVAFPKPLVSAVTGHSPAGGCILACTSDYRVMAKGERYKIGLNEMAVGIAPRQSILKLYESIIGKRAAYQFLLEGYLLSGEEALKVGLVDELADLEMVTAKAEAKMQHYLKLPQQAFMQTKKALKGPLAIDMMQSFETDLDLLHQQLMSDESRAIMGNVVAYLKSKKS